MFKPLDLGHAAFRIADVDKSRQFYEKVIGLKAIPRPDFAFKGMWYGIGSGQLHLIVSKKHDGPDRPVRISPSRLTTSTPPRNRSRRWACRSSTATR